MRNLVLLCVALCAALIQPSAPNPSDAATPRGSRHLQAATALPLHFEQNIGQSSGAVRYLARAAGYDAYLTDTGARIALRTPRHQTAPLVRAIDIGFAGASASPHITSEDPLPGRINYLRGSDPARWQTDVATFSRVRYHEVYPGVDLVFYGNERQLEYDFVVAPGADHRQVRLDFSGIDRMQIDGVGDLILHVGDRHIVQRRPVVYQEADGRRQNIDARYAALGSNRVGFEIGDYDRTAPLVIDPVLVYSTYLGGTSVDGIVGVATDLAGNVYVAGSTASANFPTRPGGYDGTFNGQIDGFVAKLNPAGTALIYSTVFGGGGLERAYEVAVDAQGAAYVTGHTNSPDFPVTAGAVNRICTSGACGFDAYVLKLNAAGTGLAYGARVGGASSDTALGIAVDSEGSAVIVGTTRSTDFPVSGGAYQVAKRGGSFSDDYFVTRLTADGSALAYSTYFGGSGADDDMVRVAVDPAGNSYVGGGTSSADFPVLNARQSSLSGDSDGFVASFGPFGALLYSTYLGGDHLDAVRDIAVDADGAAYATGRTMSANFPLVAPIDSTLGVRDAFVTKFLPGGASLAYSTLLGGEGNDGGQAIAVDADGNAHITVFAGADFPTTSDGAAAIAGADGAFYARLNDTGTELTFASFIGQVFPQDLALDSFGSAYVGGETLGVAATTRNSFQGASGGDTDGFLAKFGEWRTDPGSEDIVLYAADATTIAGGWRRVTDPNAAGYELLHHPDAGAAKLSRALAAPVHYFELTFKPEINRSYRLWIRGRAERNHWSNDSVFVQFSNSVDPGGVPIYRIGTTDAATVNLEDCANCGVSGWGWQDNGYGEGILGPPIAFASDALQTIRVQTREDGMMIDQILLADNASSGRVPGALKQDTTVLPNAPGNVGPETPPDDEIVLHAGSATLTGNWTLVADSTAAGGQRVWNPNAGLAKRTTALASPLDYVELTFTAQAGREYRLWIRGKAENDHWSNDSVHVQFSGSVDASGAPVFRIGTTSATEYNLESCIGCGVSGWGWEDNGWGTGVLGPAIQFATTGPQTIRLQVREDGLSIDQVILSPGRFLTTPPGATKNDSTIYP